MGDKFVTNLSLRKRLFDATVKGDSESWKAICLAANGPVVTYGDASRWGNKSDDDEVANLLTMQA